jgi:crossover junction endodeoxyribonuclease RusA
VSFVVEDHPAPQGSKSPKGRAKNGRMIMVESSKYVKPWREAVKAAAINRKRLLGEDGYVFADGPVMLRVIFWHRRPKAHYRTGRFSTELRPDAPEFVAIKPDLSKLIRSSEDAITAAAVWRDDSQVVKIITEQRYADTGFEGAEFTVQAVVE